MLNFVTQSALFQNYRLDYLHGLGTVQTDAAIPPTWTVNWGKPSLIHTIHSQLYNGPLV